MATPATPATPAALELRPWRRSDAPALLRAFRASPDVARQLGGVELSGLSNAEELISSTLVYTASHRNLALSLDGEAVGNFGLSNIEFRHDTAWAHYWLAGWVRGRGFAGRALATTAELGFGLGLHRIELGHRSNNPASCAVATRAGFLREGLEREKLRYGNERFDVELHARLASDPAPDLEPVLLDARCVEV